MVSEKGYATVKKKRGRPPGSKNKTTKGGAKVTKLPSRRFPTSVELCQFIYAHFKDGSKIRKVEFGDDAIVVIALNPSGEWRKWEFPIEKWVD